MIKGIVCAVASAFTCSFLHLALFYTPSRCFFLHFFPKKSSFVYFLVFRSIVLNHFTERKKNEGKEKKTSSLTNSPYGANKEIHFRQYEWHHGSQLDTNLFLFSPTFFLHYHNGAFFFNAMAFNGKWQFGSIASWK